MLTEFLAAVLNRVDVPNSTSSFFAGSSFLITTLSYYRRFSFTAVCAGVLNLWQKPLITRNGTIFFCGLL